MRRFLLFACCSLLFVLPVLAQDDVEIGPVTAAILERGALICGVTQDELPGFTITEGDDKVGFDVDFCRAVAAAVLGDADALEFVELEPATRGPALANGEIDMLSMQTTWTFSRDTGSDWDAIFAPTVFYDGQGIMVFEDSGFRTLQDLAGGTICLQGGGTTTEANMIEAMEQRELAYELQVFENYTETVDAFFDGQCDALTTDRSGLAAIRATYDDPETLRILDIVLSKEPLTPATSQDDPQFADVVRWTIYGMIQAEEFGITSENLDTFLESENPFIQRLLGLNDTPSGSYLGIPNDFMVAVIQQVGNYGEVYERWIGEDTPLGLRREGSPNDLWTRGGLMYAPPFR